MAGEQRRAARQRRALAAVLLAASCALGAGLAFSLENVVPLLVLAALLVVAPLLWHRPMVGVYLLVGGAAAFESFGLGFPDSFTDRVPFFRSLQSVGSPLPLPLYPAEVLLAGALGVVVLRRMAARQPPLALGPLAPALAAYTVAVLAGLVYGIGTGGYIPTALWEARSQLYLLPVYLLTVNLVRDLHQVRRLLWVFLVVVAFKGLVGVWRLLVTLGGDTSRIREFTTYNSMLSHEESFFFALFLALLAVLYLFHSGRGQLRFALLLSPAVVLAFLGNERRAGVLILLICVALIGLMAWTLLPSRRRGLVLAALLALAALPPYVLAFGNASGFLAEPARAVVSLYRPNERDLSSNSYRRAEAENLKYNIARNPLLGDGYGKPMALYVPLTNLSGVFDLWDTVPHNTALWVWLRLGFLGFIAFWFVVGRALVAASLAAKHAPDPYTQVVAVFSAATVIAWVVLGVLDMGLVDFRSALLVGTLLGVVDRLPQRPHGAAPARAPWPAAPPP